MNGTVPRAIKFTKKYSLPLPQNQFALFHDDMCAITKKPGFYVGIAVSLGMLKPGLILGDFTA